MLYFIGRNYRGEFGDGHTNDLKQLSAPNWNKNIHITQMYNGDGFSIYKDSNNILYSAGYNKYGSCIQESKGDKIIKARNCNIQSLQLQGIAIKSIFCDPVFGSYHGFLLTKKNKLFGFGKNDVGQLGDGTSSNINKYTSGFTLSHITFNHGIIKDIKCCRYYSLLLTMSGKVFATDYCKHGGNGQTVRNKNGSKRWNCIEWMTDGWFKNKKHQLKNISKIATGCRHSLCLDLDGKVFSFGSNYNGQLGLGTSDENTHSKPTVIPFKISVIDIACGNRHSIILGKDGNIYTFGYNYNGECGHGYFNREETITRPTKVDIDLVEDINIKIKQILCGYSHSAAIAITSTANNENNENNEIYLFGYNNYNQCIISTYNPLKDKPILINKYIEQTYKKQVSAITLGSCNTKILLSSTYTKNNYKANIDHDEKEFKDQINKNFNEEEKKERKEVRTDVHIWLKQVVKLEDYDKLFEENGFDTMNDIKNMTNDDLNTIGIKKLGHKKRIMKEINKFKILIKNKPKVEEKQEEKGSDLVKEWLTKTVGLGEYFNNFIEDGYDDMITITNSINEQDLIEMGINKKGHRKKIIIFIQKYKNENLNENNMNIVQEYLQIEGVKHVILAPNVQDTAK